MDAEHFAARLRELRNAAGLSQKELAERSGVKQNSISQLEAGDRNPIWETVIALADALGVSCDDFRRSPASEPEAPRRGRPPKADEGTTTRKPGKKK
jgi:transcriptional regulator with XRE-family HTH domain